jgi:presenilin-like A22 family membrane protease
VTQILVSILFAIAIVTLVFFLLTKIKITLIFKAWFTVVVFMCLTIAFSLLFYPLIGKNLVELFGKTFSLAEIIAVPLAIFTFSLAEIIAVPLAIFFVYFKIFRRNFIAHNVSELFIYPGLAVIFLPLLNVFVASLLLIVIAIYDVWAVWKSKHMIKLAKFHIEKLKIFPGFLLPFVSPKEKARIQKLKVAALRKAEKTKKGKGKKVKMKEIKIKVNVAGLGGGDVAFPLIFAATVMMAFNVLAALVVVLCATLSLLYLFYISKKGKFYPAMLFLTPGCLLGLLLVLLLF